MSKDERQPDPYDRLFAEAVEREDSRGASNGANVWARAGRDVLNARGVVPSGKQSSSKAGRAGKSRPPVQIETVAPTLATFLRSTAPGDRRRNGWLSYLRSKAPGFVERRRNLATAGSRITQRLPLLAAVILCITSVLVLGQPT